LCKILQNHPQSISLCWIKTSSNGKAGAKKPEDHETVKHRVPLFLITIFWPHSLILAAALTKEYSPESCLASSSLLLHLPALSLQVTLAMRNPSKIHGI
jgi:hypothetical protein